MPVHPVGRTSFEIRAQIPGLPDPGRFDSEEVGEEGAAARDAEDEPDQLELGRCTLAATLSQTMHTLITHWDGALVRRVLCRAPGIYSEQSSPFFFDMARLSTGVLVLRKIPQTCAFQAPG